MYKTVKLSEGDKEWINKITNLLEEGKTESTEKTNACMKTRKPYITIWKERQTNDRLFEKTELAKVINIVKQKNRVSVGILC